MPSVRSRYGHGQGWSVIVVFQYRNGHMIVNRRIRKGYRMIQKTLSVSECEQPRLRFSVQKSRYCSAYTETQPQSFQTKTQSAAFQKVSLSKGWKLWSSVDARCNRNKCFLFKPHQWKKGLRLTKQKNVVEGHSSNLLTWPVNAVANSRHRGLFSDPALNGFIQSTNELKLNHWHQNHNSEQLILYIHFNQSYQWIL